jgi:hypothetical protein
MDPIERSAIPIWAEITALLGLTVMRQDLRQEVEIGSVSATTAVQANLS